MLDIRSITAGGRDTAGEVARVAFPRFSQNFPTKLYWFLTHGYNPHAFQGAFHSASSPLGLLMRYRHLVAGRRGGKTLSAAWDVIFYCLHPAEFHMDAHGLVSERPLWVQVLAKDHKVGFASEAAIREVLDAAGLVKDKDYKWNKSEKYIEFQGGTLLQFKTAVDPQSLRGAGLDILWVDESAAITTDEAWNVIRPSMVDKPGLLITTTTPNGKNWFYESFFVGEALEDAWQFRVEYTSLDNPYLDKDFIEYERRHMHPSLFKQEYLASFDAMSGLTLSGDWLHYYSIGSENARQGSVAIPRARDGRIQLNKFIGIDPSTGEGADDFAMVCVGILEDRSMAFVLDYIVDKMPFPEQMEKIREWFLKYRPDHIGIESNVFQRIYAQQTARMPGMPSVIPVFSKGQKNSRIISMSPVFKTGQVRIHQSHVKFIDQWVSFDGTRKDNRDDLLDAMEIALGVAGVLLPTLDVAERQYERPVVLREGEEAAAQIADLRHKQLNHPTLGSEA